MYKEVVVGFDVREMWLDVNHQWPEKRKEEFLIKPGILKPLSVDHYIWHSVLSEAIEPRLWLDVPRQAKYFGSEWDNVFSGKRKLSEPDGYRPRRVWRNLSSLQDYLHKKWGSMWNPCYLVAVVEIISDGFDMEEDDKEVDPILPNVVDSQWRLLGYDVADYELITGLFEGVIEPGEAPGLRNEWEKHLNEHHLFVEPQKAFEFIPVANRKYPSHMPYYVYALYGIQEINPSRHT